MSFNANPFHEGDIRQRAAIISPAFKENFSELELEIIKFQNRLITNNCRDQQTHLEYSVVCTVPCSKQALLKLNGHLVLLTEVNQSFEQAKLWF